MNALVEARPGPILHQQLRPATGFLAPAQVQLRGGERRLPVIRCAIGQAPKFLKYRKYFRGDTKGHDDNPFVRTGEYGMQILEGGMIKAETIEAMRRVIIRRIRGRGKLHIRVIPHLPYTARAAESRMGGGKGAVAGYVARCRAGKILFELQGVSLAIAKEAIKAAGYKIGLKTRLAERTEKPPKPKKTGKKWFKILKWGEVVYHRTKPKKRKTSTAPAAVAAAADETGSGTEPAAAENGAGTEPAPAENGAGTETAAATEEAGTEPPAQTSDGASES